MGGKLVDTRFGAVSATSVPGSFQTPRQIRATGCARSIPLCGGEVFDVLLGLSSQCVRVLAAEQRVHTLDEAEAKREMRYGDSSRRDASEGEKQGCLEKGCRETSTRRRHIGTPPIIILQSESVWMPAGEQEEGCLVPEVHTVHHNFCRSCIPRPDGAQRARVLTRSTLHPAYGLVPAYPGSQERPKVGCSCHGWGAAKPH